MTDVRIAFAQPDQPPRYHHTDVDGDRLLITTADIPGAGPGVYFKTDPNGSSVPLAELPSLIAKLTAIAGLTPSTPPSDDHAAIYIDQDGDPWVEYLTSPRTDQVVPLVMAPEQAVDRAELVGRIGGLTLVGWCRQA